MVDGELLFFFAQLFPDTLRLGDVLFGELQDVVVVVPEEAELFVAGFFFWSCRPAVGMGIFTQLS